MLTELRDADDPARFGGKAVGLRQALGLGCRVPPSAVLPVEDVAGLTADPAAATEAAASVVAWARRHGVVHLALRSSASAEDSTRHSYAGIFHSAFSVVDPNAVADALVEVGKNLHSAQRTAYESAFNIQPGSRGMAILIQATVPSRTSGVMFSWGPADDRRYRIQAAWGLGLDLVQGVTTGDAVEDRVATDTVRTTIGNKPLALMPADPEGHAIPGDYSLIDFGDGPNAAKVVFVDEDAGLTYLRLPENLAAAPCLSSALLEELKALGRRSPDAYRLGSDIEWVQDVTGRVWIVQMRPITTAQPEVEAASDNDAALSHSTDEQEVVRGEPGAPGKFSGPVSDTTTILDYNHADGRVLVCGAARPELMPAVARAAALVSSDGGMLCHIAIVSRELGKPCVIGVTNAESRFRREEVLTVDGTAGTVRRSEGRAGAGSSDQASLAFIDDLATARLDEHRKHAVIGVVAVGDNERFLTSGTPAQQLLTALRTLTVFYPASLDESTNGSSLPEVLQQNGFTRLTHLRHWTAANHHSLPAEQAAHLLTALDRQGVS